jgi:hypothetical protein
MKDIIRMNQLAGIITEGQARKMMQILNEDIDENDRITSSFKSSPKSLPWNNIEQAFKKSGLTGEEFFSGAENKFRQKFENKPVSREEYYNFFTNLPSTSGQDDLYIMVNWISFTNPKLADELYGMI